MEAGHWMCLSFDATFDGVFFGRRMDRFIRLRVGRTSRSFPVMLWRVCAVSLRRVMGDLLSGCVPPGERRRPAQL